MATNGDLLLSRYLLERDIGFGIDCTRKIITSEDIGDVLYTDRRARISDMQECIRNVWTVCKEESVVTMNSGAIINMAQEGIEFTITNRGLAIRRRKGDDHIAAPVEYDVYRVR